MDRITIRLVALLAALAVGLLVAPTAGSARDSRCKARGKTLAANSIARVYSRRDRDTDGTRVLGCHYRKNRPWLLGREFGEFDVWRVEPMRLRGRYAGYVAVYHGRDGLRANLEVRDLRSGRVRHRRAWTSEDSIGTRYRNEFEVTDLELKRYGAVAWIVRTQYREPGDPPNYGPVQFAVYKSDAAGAGMLLDRHEAIAEDSLALSGSTLFWTKNGEPQTAPLY